MKPISQNRPNILKTELHRTLQSTLKSSLILAALFMLWVMAVKYRAFFIRPVCLMDPTACTKSSINFIDRVTVNFEIGFFDWLSFRTQEVAIFLSLVLPLLVLIIGCFKRGFKTQKCEIIAWLRNLSFILRVISLNGLLTEVARIIVQRPRPFVYKDPLGLGLDPSHYTSFYSGHTSFVTASLTATYLFYNRRLLSRQSRLVMVLFITLIFLTALGRVLSGRHFISDTIVAMVFGFFTAKLVFWFEIEDHLNHAKV